MSVLDEPVLDLGETIVSGNIISKRDTCQRERESYVIRNPITGQGWGLPVDWVQPEDLRVLADRIEFLRRVGYTKKEDLPF